MTEPTGGSAGGGDAFAAIWQACVYLRFPDQQIRQVADYLATSARRPGTATVELDPYTMHRLLLAVDLCPDRLRHTVARLTDAGLLTPIEGHDGEPHCVHTLTMPPHPVTSARATEPGS